MKEPSYSNVATKTRFTAYTNHSLPVLARGKAHKAYEFGNKVGLILNPMSRVITAISAFKGNPHNSKTIAPVLDQMEGSLGYLPEELVYDRGGKGAKDIKEVTITTPGKTLKGIHYIRRELKQLDALLSTNESLLKLAKGDASLPKVNLVIDGGFQGFSYSFDEEQDYIMAQLSLNWNIFQGGAKKSKIKEKQFELNRLSAQKEQLQDQVELQVVTALNEYSAALESVSAAEARALSAQNSFNLIQKKYLESQVILIEYLEASNNYTSAQLSHSIAQYQVFIKASELNKIIAKK